jgi:SAM-dependent methyltransferase
VDFHRRLRARGDELPGELIVREWGVGSGRFAADFLDRMQALDEVHETAFYPRLCYVLGDVSEKMICEARRHPRLRDHLPVTRFEIRDATDLSDLPAGTTLLVRFNELYDDLPGTEILLHTPDGLRRLAGRVVVPDEARAVRRCDGEAVPGSVLRELLRQGRDEDLVPLEPGFLEDITWTTKPVSLDLDTFPYGDFIARWSASAGEGAFPVNLGAAGNLVQAFRLLAPGGYFLISDYGFDSPRYVDATPESEKILRSAGQPTAWVHFPLLRHVVEERLGGRFELRTQSDWLSRQEGRRVIGRELCTLARATPGALPNDGERRKAMIRRYAELTRGEDRVWVTGTDLLADHAVAEAAGSGLAAMLEAVFAAPYAPIRGYFQAEVTPPSRPGDRA